MNLSPTISSLHSLELEYKTVNEPKTANLAYLPFNREYYKSLIQNDKIYPFQWFLKRVIDISGSLVGLICLSPLLLLIALLIKLDSKGPVLFKQERLGYQGKMFDMYKFRSMRTDAELQLAKLLSMNESNEGMFKMLSDPRVTSVGRFLRKYSLDELPQLINVLKGDMSLVGPRPPIERELESYKNWHYVRLSTIPGLTGMWQVSGRSSIKDFDHVVMLDYTYIRDWNLWVDLKILLKTVPVVLSGENVA